VGLGLEEGLLKQLPIADGTGAAAKAAPLSREGLNAPAEPMASPTDDLISPTGTAMQEEMNSPTTAALEPGGGDALNGPGQITTTPGDDDHRAVDKNRRRQQAREGQRSGRGHCSRRQAHGYRANERGKLSEDYRFRRVPPAMGSWPLAQPLFYQYKRTEGQAELLQGNGTQQANATGSRASSMQRRGTE
jgi:hypothetical protein